MNPEKLSPTSVPTKQHFELLDGLRGVAAFAIVVFHFMEWVFTDFSKNFIAHGFLAVDFFFCLSGFVIGYAYDNRLEQMGKAAFFRRRLIRLHPLVVLGSVLGLLAYLLDPFEGPPAQLSTFRLALLFLASLFLVPFPVMEDRAFNVFGLNAPAWSLFWEYAANLLYALVLYRLGRRSLAVLIVVAAITLCCVSYSAGNLLGGWSKDNFWHGGARVGYSFLAGLFLYRSNWIIRNRLGFPGLAVLLCLAFLMPWSDLNWLTEALVVLVYFPLIVSLGAGAAVAPGLRKVCRLSGELSYPLYMTHYAGIWIFGHYLTAGKPGPEQLAYIIPLGVLFLIGIAYAALAGYDRPLRNYLSKKARQRQRAQA